jgi:hypothetical protein
MHAPISVSDRTPPATHKCRPPNPLAFSVVIINKIANPAATCRQLLRGGPTTIALNQISERNDDKSGDPAYFRKHLRDGPPAGRNLKTYR